jgi:PAS domain S-box-containing protein
MNEESQISNRSGPRLLPHRLKSRLIFFFMVVLLIPGILVPAFSFGFLRSVFLDAKIDESLLMVRQHTRLLEGLLEMRSVELLMISQMSETRRFFNAVTPEAREEEKRYLIQALQAYLLKRPGLIQGVKVLDAQGIRQFSVRENLEVDLEPVNLSGRSFYAGAMNISAIRGQEIPVYISHPTPESPVYYSSLVLDDAGVVAGMLVLDVSMNSLMDSLIDSTPGEMCQMFDAQGRPLIHRHLSSGEKIQCTLKGFLVPEDIQYMLSRPKGVLSSTRGPENSLILFSRARPRGQSAIQWTLVYSIPLRPILVPFLQAAGIVGVLTLVSVAGAVVIAMGFSRSMTRPLSQLATAANDLCHGFWDTMLPETKYDDEVSELAGAFGTMCRQLKLAHGDLLKKVEDLHVSEKKQIEEKERLIVTLRSIGEAVIAVDLSGNIEIANAKAAELFRMDVKDLIGKPVNDFVSLYNQTLGEPVGDLVEMSRSSGEKAPAGHHELLLMRKDREATQVEVALSPIRNEKSEMFGVVIVIRDVSELRKILLERNRMEKLQSLGVLAGGIAHDFNNLISVVMGDLSLLCEGATDPEESRRIAEHALQATQRARNLTGQLLTFSKGGAPIKKTASLRDLLTETADFALHGTKCTCEVKVQPKLWPANVDPDQIHQVFHNLTINAVQSMPDGGKLEIVLENADLKNDECPPLPGGKYIRVKVKDEGAGIPPEDLSSIFDPYFTTKSAGHGLGLSTVHSIVQAHGGLTQVKSDSSGTAFTVYLPASPDGKPVMAKPKAVKTGEMGSIRILVLDDDPAIRMTSTRLLKHVGHDVAAVEDGKEALKVYSEAKASGAAFDLVILDLTLPGGKNGVSVLKDLKAVDPDVVAIVSSGYSQDPVMAHYSEYGFQGMIQKPYTLAELQACLERVVQGR